MPDIIEQQDLLKGLPDTRLAMLLQNPVGDIPPFLVAAEAQRRQAIRQQFAGSENKESIVDSLIKQLANVPQNIGGKTSPTEEVPDLKGILEKNQEIQDQISSQQEKDASQSMASGGIVRRFAGGGVASLAPKGTSYGFSSGIPAQTALGSLARASSVIPQTMGVMPGNIGYQAKPAQPQQPPQPQQMRGGGMVQRYQVGGKVQPWWQIPDLSDTFSGITGYLGEKIGDLAEFATTPYSERQAREEGSAVLPSLDAMTPEELAEFNASVAIPDVPVGGARPAPPKPRLRPDDLVKPAPGETPDEFRARLEALYAAQEPSDLEKAEKYFNMAQQFFDPSKTTMQSIAGAGQVFAQSAAEQARAQREAELAREKAMLEYDMGLAQQRREAAAAERQRTSLSADQQANILVKSQESVRKIMESKERQLQDLQSDPISGRLDPTLPDKIAALKKEIAKDAERLMRIEGALAALGQQAYGNIPFDTYSLNSGFAR